MLNVKQADYSATDLTYSTACLNWAFTALHTLNTFIIICLCICAVDLFFVFKRARGKFAMVTLLWLVGLTCIGIASWATMTKFWESLFSQSGSTLCLIGLIFMG